MAGFRFLFVDLQQEIMAMRQMAEPFFDSRMSLALDAFSRDLKSIENLPPGTVRQLDLEPLQTIESEGEYEAGTKKGGRKIFAVISGRWELCPLGKRSSKRTVEFCGKASTRIALYEPTEPRTRLAMWRLELGTKDSPGCYIHAQILGDCDVPPFPKSVPIPRLPSVFVTPMSAIEFVLSELFQDHWRQRTERSAGEVHNWYRLQLKWLQSQLSWYQRELKSSESSSSPWVTLKTAKPDGKLFVSDK